MRILTVGFSGEYAKQLIEELNEYFICIVDNAIDIYDATNFTDFRHYELVIIVDEGVDFSLERYVNEVKKKKSELLHLMVKHLISLHTLHFVKKEFFQKMRLLMHFGLSQSM